MKRRSVVRTSGLIPRRGRPVLWAVGYADLALLFGMTVAAVRKAVARGQFNPGDLGSVIAYATARAAKQERRMRPKS